VVVTPPVIHTTTFAAHTMVPMPTLRGPDLTDLRAHIVAVPDFPLPGILFRDVMPLLRTHFEPTIAALDALLTTEEWAQVDAIAGIEARGFIMGAALALRRGKGFIPIRKQGKLPPPVSSLAYQLEYGTATLEMQPGSGRVIVVDDVMATGGTMTAAAELCARSGFTVSALVALIDLKLIPELRGNGLALRAALLYE
jgi:adenine phosphoribosyltransferase